MVKHNKPVSQPEQIVSDVQAMPAETAENIVSIADKAKRNRLNALATVDAAETAVIRDKVQLLHDAETAIAETVELAGNSEDNTELASQIAEAASRVGDILFRGRVQGIISPDETSELLGKGFGWKTKQNGEQSKTPFGQGEVIRKRVVRATDAYAFVTGRKEDAKAFFEPLEASVVKPMVQAVIKGERSVFTLYNDLSEMKANASGTRPKPAFNPKNVLAVASSLTENVAASVALWHDTPGLFEAYVGLYRAMNLISEEYGDKYADEIKAA